MKGAPWHDLLAVPFERANCYDLAVEFCRRLGIALPPLEVPWSEAGTEIGPALEYVGPTPSCARQLGDLIVGDPKRLGYASHVAVLVEPGVALSTSRDCGPFSARLIRHPCEYGVWRSRLKVAP